VRQEVKAAASMCRTRSANGSGEPLFVGDLLERPLHPSKKPDSQERIIVPLRSRDRILGIMFLYPRQGHMPSDHDRRLLASISSQIGMAIENTRLYENLRFYIREITRAQENERRRIAQELHDDTIQMFIAISRRLEALATLPEALPESAMRHIEQLQELTGSALRGVRYFVQDLRPPILDHLGLVAALEGLAGAMEKTGIEAELRTVGRLRRLKPEEELVLFRIAQETLNNVRKHAAASRVTIQLEFHPGKARMSLKDNGRGFDAPTRVDELFATGRLGLIGMYERAQLLGGALRIQSEPGSGTTITVEIPVRAAAQGADS
jgi:two-component system sensor histidine kinase DegS